VVNLNLLTKILGLLSSPNDHEALQAARRADAMVRAAGTSWAALLAQGATAGGGDVDAAAAEVPLKDQIASAFKELGEAVVKGDKRWVDLLAKFRANEGYLTKAERAPLFAEVKRRRKIL
jgi:hypothetical protein